MTFTSFFFVVSFIHDIPLIFGAGSKDHDPTVIGIRIDPCVGRAGVKNPEMYLPFGIRDGCRPCLDGGHAGGLLSGRDDCRGDVDLRNCAGAGSA